MPSLFSASTHLITFFMLASLRVATALASLPAPFGSVAPIRIRTAVSVVITAAICASLSAQAPDLGQDVMQIFKAALGEMLLGAVIGMTVRVTLAAADMAGSMAGQSMGLGFATTMDPSQGEATLATAHLLASFATVVFFAFDGHHAVIGALAASFRSAPVGQEWHAIAQSGIVDMASRMMARGLQIAAPVVATMFIVQLGTALASRAAPRVQLFAFSFSIAAAAGMLVLWVAAPSLATAINVQVQRLPLALAEIVGGR